MKRILFALLILASPVFAQRGQPLELVSVKDKIFHFQMGNVHIAARCQKVPTIWPRIKTSDDCGWLLPELGSSLPYCQLGKFDDCYGVNSGELVLQGYDQGVVNRWESYHVVTMEKRKK